MTPRRFASDRARWFVVALTGTAALSLGMAVIAIPDARARPALFVTVAALVAVGVWLLWILISLGHEVGPQGVRLRAALLRRRIAHAEIQEIRPARSLVSSWASSHVRLAIRLKGRSMPVWVSPADRPGFLRAIAEADVDLVVEGNTSRRRA